MIGHIRNLIDEEPPVMTKSIAGIPGNDIPHRTVQYSLYFPTEYALFCACSKKLSDVVLLLSDLRIIPGES